MSRVNDAFSEGTIRIQRVCVYMYFWRLAARSALTEVGLSDRPVSDDGVKEIAASVRLSKDLLAPYIFHYFDHIYEYTYNKA